MLQTPWPVLTLPGWQNSDPEHWQSRWEQVYGYQRVEQHDWMRPLRGDWMARLEDVLLNGCAPAVLVAHSLGCIHAAAWASHSKNTGCVRAALLVAPPDTERDDVRQMFPSWAPLPLQKLPFKSLVIASSNDPFCSLERAGYFADAWGADFVALDECGHINSDSGLGDWPEAHARLLSLMADGFGVSR